MSNSQGPQEHVGVAQKSNREKKSVGFESWVRELPLLSSSVAPDVASVLRLAVTVVEACESLRAHRLQCGLAESGHMEAEGERRPRRVAVAHGAARSAAR